MKKRNLHPFLFAAFAFLLLFQLMLFWHAGGMALRGFADFSSFYSAAWIVLSGMGHQLYSANVQAHVQSLLYPNAVTRNGLLPYIHPPFEVLVYLPFAYMPYPVAYTIWVIFSILLLLLTVGLLWPYMKELKNLWAPLPVLGVFCFFPVFVDLLQGQDSVLLLLIFTLVFINLKEGKDLRAGLFLALTLFKFQYTLPFLVPFLLWQRWKCVGGFAISSAFLFLLSLSITGLRGTLSYVTFLLNLVRGVSPHHIQNALGIMANTMPNIRGAVEMMAPDLLPHSIQKLIIVLFSGVAVLWVVKKWPLGRSLSAKTFELGFSLALVTSIMASYHLQLHDLSLLLIPFILVLNRILKGEIFTGPRRFAMYGVITLFCLSPLYLLLMRRGLMYLFFWPILAFFLMLSWELVYPANGSEPVSRENLPGPVTRTT